MNMNNLSIIVPHYNIPTLLYRLLLSIPDREDIEVIVVDDCSTESLENVKQYIGKRRNIRLYEAVQNFGAGKCRNYGLGKAKGRWIMFADADDYFLDGFYDEVSAHFSETADIVFFTATSEEIVTKTMGSRHVLFNDTIREWTNNQTNKKAELNIRYKTNAPWCKLIKRDLIVNNHIYFDNVRVSNDEMFSTKTAFYASIISTCLNPIYCVTSRPGSLTDIMSKENFMIRLKVFIRKYHFLKSHLTSRDFKLLDLSAQEKVFSMLHNHYSFIFEVCVINELIRGRVPFLTMETFKPKVFISKIKLAYTLSGMFKEKKVSR